MRLALLILTSLAIMTLIAGVMALVDIFDPLGAKAIFGTTLGLLFFSIGLTWVFYLDRVAAERKLDQCTRLHAVTGLLNRQESLRLMEIQVKAARRHRFPVTIVLVAMDGFSEINRRMGHKGGDIILKQVGERIQQVIRDEDIAGHYEGDLFLIGAPHADETGAMKLAERLHALITVEPYKTRGVSTHVSARLSVVVAPPADYDLETLMHSAEERLRQAKHQGGNAIRATD